MTITTWLWGTKYAEDDVLKLYCGLRRNTDKQFRFLVSTDRRLDLPSPIEQTTIEDPELIGRGCFCRLRMFDPAWQRRNGIIGRVANIDLDAVIVKNYDDILNRSDSFTILSGVNAVNPNPYNCSLMLLQVGKHADIWNKFSLSAISEMKYHEFPDDQGWIWHMLPNSVAWVGGEASGVYGFRKPGWRGPDHYLPRNARIIAFIGSKKPYQYKHLPWVTKHWRGSL